MSRMPSKYSSSLATSFLPSPRCRVAGVVEHRVEHAPLLGEHGLLLLDRRRVFREEAMIGLERTVLSADRLAAHVPRHRQTRTVTRVLRLVRCR